MRKKIIGVIGGHSCTREVKEMCVELGQNLAKVADILVCGGLSGTMEAVCQGFKAAGGEITIGIIPTYNRKDANQYVDIIIPTGLGFARNVLVVKTADIIIALPGEEGTLSEIAYALQFGVPLISLGSWDVSGVIKADKIEEVIKKVRKKIG